MEIQVSSHHGDFKMPVTTKHELLDGQLVLFLRSWGSQDYDQKLIDEISHFLSTAQADIEVTSPFDYLENLTPLANKARIALLLAHDYFYKVENKSTFSVGFEVLLLVQSKNEMAWGAVGRFDLYESNDAGEISTLTAAGTDRDFETLLPVELLGVEKELDLRSGSARLHQKTLIASSVFRNRILISKADALNIEHTNSDGTYWTSTIKSE